MRGLRRRRATSVEESAHEGTTLLREDAGIDYGVMVEAGLAKEVDDAATGAGLGVGCAEYHARHSGMHQRAGAHGTRLERDVEDGARQAIIADALRSCAQRLDLCVSSRIAERDGQVVAFAH